MLGIICYIQLQLFNDNIIFTCRLFICWKLWSLQHQQETFLSQHISGEILLECDGHVLVTEVKITSKLHPVHLMKLITGRPSAEIKGGDSYVYATNFTKAL